ncbi:hypothetical protein COOONC_11127 [Cooperia oncophora]
MEPPTYPEISFISKSGTKLLEKNIGNNFLDVLNCSSLYDSVLNGCLEVKRRVMPRKPLNSTLRAQICPEMTTSITSSAEQYYREFAAPYYRDFDVPRFYSYLALFAIYTCIAVAGVSFVKLTLAYAYIAIIVILCVSMAMAMSMAGPELIIKKLWLHTDPEALNRLQTYAQAVALSVRTSGIATWGLMSAATLRERRRGSYGKPNFK